jgi:hypothetical protein
MEEFYGRNYPTSTQTTRRQTLQAETLERRDSTKEICQTFVSIDSNEV